MDKDVSATLHQSTVGNRSIPEAVDDIAQLVASADVDTASSGSKIHAALAKTYEIHLRAKSSSIFADDLSAMIKTRKIKVRSGANPHTSLVKLCFPGRKASDYNRYADALRFAVESNMAVADFIEALGWEGGMTMLAKNAKEHLSKPNGRVGKDASKLQDAMVSLKKRKAMANFNGSGDAGIVLMIGERAANGIVSVRALLDSQEQRKFAEKLIIRFCDDIIDV